MTTTPFRKISILFAGYALLHLVAACWPICDCPKVDKPYFDYHGLQLEVNDPVVNGRLDIAIEPDSIVFVADAGPRFQWINSAYGCSCEAEGERGDKYEPLSVDVFADRAFNDTLPAGASLRAVFRGVSSGNIITLLSDQNQPAAFGHYDNKYTLQNLEQPTQAGAYHFQIRWVKSNGDTLSAWTAPVVFF